MEYRLIRRFEASEVSRRWNRSPAALICRPDTCPLGQGARIFGRAPVRPPVHPIPPASRCVTHCPRSSPPPAPPEITPTCWSTSKSASSSVWII